MLSRMLARTNPKLRPDLICNPRSKIVRGPIVHRNHNNAAHRASKKRRYPLGAVLSPKHHPVALSDSALLQFAAETKRHLHDLPIGEPFHAVAAMLPVGPLIAVRLEVHQEKFC